jgi:hypothetical protein
MTTLTVRNPGAASRPVPAERPGVGETAQWQALYRAGGIAALTVLALVPVQMAVFFLWPPPTTVTEWFALFQSNALVGLLDMDFLLTVDFVLMGLFFIALYPALRRTSPSLMAIAVASELVAVATYFASTVAFEMLSLSGQYAVATSDAERSSLLAAGQVMFATWQGTAFDVSYVLAGIAALTASIVMLRAGVFGRLAGYSGILMGTAALVPPTVGAIGLVLSLLSLLPLLPWLFLCGRGLLRLARARG